MEREQANREQLGAGHARSAASTTVYGGAQADSSGRYMDYGFSLPSTNKDVQVRYVDCRNDPSSHPHWVLTDNTTPKYDPCRGLWSHDRAQKARREATFELSADVSTTAVLIKNGAADGTSPASNTDPDTPNSRGDDIRNGM
jgi:hypothetical protein